MDIYWHEKAYKITREEITYPIKSYEGFNLAVLVNPAENWARGLSRLVTERYPETKELYKIEESEHEIRYLKNTIKVKLRNGDTMKKNKRVYTFPFKVDTVERIASHRLFELLSKLRDKMIQRKGKRSYARPQMVSTD